MGVFLGREGVSRGKMGGGVVRGTAVGNNHKT